MPSRVSRTWLPMTLAPCTAYRWIPLPRSWERTVGSPWMRLSTRLTSAVPSTQIPKPRPCRRLFLITAPRALGWMNSPAFMAVRSCPQSRKVQPSMPTSGALMIRPLPCPSPWNTAPGSQTICIV
ncbi:hypothetical protein D3C87_1514610 [compost metagenome]